MPQVVLRYFPFKALGEPTRLLLAYGGVKFEDHWVSPENWSAFKPETPFGQMPVLVIDGKEYAQSTAIARYLGRKFGLAGADIEEDFEIDQIAEYLNDIRVKISYAHYEPDETLKAKRHENYTKNVYPVLLAKLDATMKANKGYLACSKLTWADFVFAGIYAYLKSMMQAPDLDSQYPSFKKLEETVYSLPKVKAWAKTAPKYERGS